METEALRPGLFLSNRCETSEEEDAINRSIRGKSQEETIMAAVEAERADLRIFTQYVCGIRSEVEAFIERCKNDVLCFNETKTDDKRKLKQ